MPREGELEGCVEGTSVDTDFAIDHYLLLC